MSKFNVGDKAIYIGSDNRIPKDVTLTLGECCTADSPDHFWLEELKVIVDDTYFMPVVELAEWELELLGIATDTAEADASEETLSFEESTEPWPEDDPVNHPSHYTFGKYEVLDVIEDWELSYHLGNATKYIARAGRKDPAKEKQDLEKAVFYINRRIAQL